MYDELAAWVAEAVQSGPSTGRAAGLDAIVDAIRGGVSSVESASHGEPVTDRPWPVVVTLRGSEVSQTVRDQWLHSDLRAYLGPGKDLGVRPAKGGVHKRLLHGLPEELSHGKGQRKRIGVRNGSTLVMVVVVVTQKLVAEVQAGEFSNSCTSLSCLMLSFCCQRCCPLDTVSARCRPTLPACSHAASFLFVVSRWGRVSAGPFVNSRYSYFFSGVLLSRAFVFPYSFA